MREGTSLALYVLSVYMMSVAVTAELSCCHRSYMGHRAIYRKCLWGKDGALLRPRLWARSGTSEEGLSHPATQISPTDRDPVTQPLRPRRPTRIVRSLRTCCQDKGKEHPLSIFPLPGTKPSKDIISVGGNISTLWMRTQRLRKAKSQPELTQRPYR